MTRARQRLGVRKRREAHEARERKGSASWKTKQELQSARRAPYAFSPQPSYAIPCGAHATV